MGREGKSGKETEKAGQFVLEGIAKLQPGEDREALELKAIAVTRDGTVVGEAKVSGEGEFRIPLALKQPQDVQLLIGPAETPYI
ncbi:MAG: hypothetical protein U5J83_08150 [Bryobacterales bacterium]|nr:hypothetical protein [Bryobacterales bacterium]